MSSNSLTADSPSILTRIEKWVPGITAVRTYQRQWVGRDLVAGLDQIGGGIADVYLAAGDIVLATGQGQRFGEAGDGMLGCGVGG